MADVRVVVVLVAVLVGYGVTRTAQSRLRKHGGHVLAYRWLTGQPWHGKPVTDRGWFRAGSKALTPTGHATRWHHLPRWKATLWRTGSTLTGLTALIGFWRAPTVTSGIVIFVTFLVLLVLAYMAVRRVLTYKRRRTWLHPLHLAAHELAGWPRASLASSWIRVRLDESKAVEQVRLALPPGWPADDRDKVRLASIVSAKLGIESPDVSWRLAGPSPMVTMTVSEPPPRRVELADIRAELDQARESELVWGIGKQRTVVKSSLAGDSPHLGLSMGSGGGKSIAARALVAQRLYRGDIGLFLDYKMISHQWAAGLPNAVIVRRPHEIHRALMWLDRELDRRNEVALAGADIEGNVRAVVGPRLIVVAEELNATMTVLRRYWQQVRASDDAKRSPAVEALDKASFMGRQILVNLIYIGQRLSVKASGGDGDARENIGVVAFARFTPSNWKMLAGDHPKPPNTLQPGRMQIVTDRVRETQGVFMTAVEARQLALAGIVTPVPGSLVRAVGGVPAATPIADSGAEQPVVPETSDPLGQPGVRVTLAEAVGQGVVSRSLGAVRKASQRPGFPQRRGLRGLAAEYDAGELAAWDSERR